MITITHTWLDYIKKKKKKKIDCRIGAEGACALSESLKSNSTLTELGLGCNNVKEIRMLTGGRKMNNEMDR